MTDRLGELLADRPALRRLAWRVGRRLYTSARGERMATQIESDGETYLQEQVIANVPQETTLQFLDIGANQGDWTSHLLSQLPNNRRLHHRVRVNLFEPIAATRERLAATLAAIDTDGLCEVHALALSNSAG